MKKSELKKLIREEIQNTSNNADSTVDGKKWKSILMPFYKEVIQKIGSPDMSLNIYSRWIGNFIRYANTFTSYEGLVKYGLSSEPKTEEDLKNELIRFINLYRI